VLSRPLTRLLFVGAPALALAAAAQLVTPPATAIDPIRIAAPQGTGQVLAATTPAAAATAAPTSAPEPTAAPTPVPTAVPTPEPTAAPTAPPATPRAVPPPTAPPAPPAPPRSRLVSDDGRLDTSVGVYSDCSGATVLSHAYAAVDTCVTSTTYFVGHNPGVFTPLLSETVGSVITWWDGSGTAHRLRVVATRTWLRVNGVPPLASGAVVAQFQTCLVPDGSKDLILDAVPA